MKLCLKQGLKVEAEVTGCHAGSQQGCLLKKPHKIDFFFNSKVVLRSLIACNWVLSTYKLMWAIVFSLSAVCIGVEEKSLNYCSFLYFVFEKRYRGSSVRVCIFKAEYRTFLLPFIFLVILLLTIYSLSFLLGNR